jgi:predicted nuclease of restriction endonuclease-like (RecB) superfamily
MFIDDELKRSFYLEMARLEHWDTRTLDQKNDAMLYERTALSRKPEELIKQELKLIQSTNSLSPDVVFRSSYFLDALGLADTYSEKNLEDAILLSEPRLAHYKFVAAIPRLPRLKMWLAEVCQVKMP